MLLSFGSLLLGPGFPLDEAKSWAMLGMFLTQNPTAFSDCHCGLADCPHCPGPQSTLAEVMHLSKCEVLRSQFLLNGNVDPNCLFCSLALSRIPQNNGLEAPEL